jgi:hypothetical protein
MSFTFDPAASTQTDLHKVRQRIGDVVSTDALLTDEQINALVASAGSWLEAARDCVNLILAKIAREVSRSAVGLSGQRDQQWQHYIDLRDGIVDELASGSSASATVAYPVLVGPNEKSKKDSMRLDTDYEAPRFTREQWDNNQ